MKGAKKTKSRRHERSSPFPSAIDEPSAKKRRQNTSSEYDVGFNSPSPLPPVRKNISNEHSPSSGQLPPRKPSTPSERSDSSLQLRYKKARRRKTSSSGISLTPDDDQGIGREPTRSDSPEGSQVQQSPTPAAAEYRNLGTIKPLAPRVNSSPSNTQDQPGKHHVPVRNVSERLKRLLENPIFPDDEEAQDPDDDNDNGEDRDVDREARECDGGRRKESLNRDNTEREPGVQGSRISEETSPGCIQTCRKDNHGVEVHLEERLTTKLDHMLRALETRIANRIDSLDARGAQGIESVQSLLKSAISQLQDLIVVAGVSGASGSKSNTPLAIWESKLDEMTPNVSWVFSEKTLARVLSSNLPAAVMGIVKERGEFVEKAAAALATIMFGLKHNESRNEYKQGWGKRHSLFRLTVVYNAIFNVQRDAFNMFLDADDNRSKSDGERTGQVGLASPADDEEQRNDPKQIHRPSWLAPRYVLADDVRDAQAHIETTKNGRKEKIKETPTVRDIARWGAIKVYRVVMANLHGARDRVKVIFFDELGYLMANWSSYTSDVDQRRLKVKFANASALPRKSVQNIPDTVVVTGTGSPTNADTKNKELLLKFYSDCEEMILTATHHVHVVPAGKTSKRRQGGEMRRIYRIINILEVATKFVTEFVQAKSEVAFLRCNKDALRCIYAIALVFRGFVERFLAESSYVDNKLADPPSVRCGTYSLDNIMPGYTTAKRRLESRTLRMNENSYAVLNVLPIPSTAADRNGEARGNGGGATGEEICPSNTFGIALL